MATEKIHFVTGRLAEPALRNILAQIASGTDPDRGFSYSIDVLPITVAALMTPKWIAKHITIPPETDRIILPGYCGGDLAPLVKITELPIATGPKDLRRLPEFFGQKSIKESFGNWDIDIIAEINHAPRLTIEEIVSVADVMRADGATLIDVGCLPGETWAGVADCIHALKSEGHRVSVDSLNPDEISAAATAGAELVLSVNSTNREYAPNWGIEVVAIPDDIRDINSLEPTIEFLSKNNVPFRIDPILEPIGLGFTSSIKRYIDVRARWPDVEIMMGVGNLTELTDVDSAGVNMLLIAICQELGIRSVLTTQVINWARSSVKEIDIARRIAWYSVNENIPPKRISEDLVSLRDPKLVQYDLEQIQTLADNIKDNNYRILAELDQIHLLGSGVHFSGDDPFDLFDQLADTNPKNLDPSHAFYLGYEMCKAMLALQLGKQYTQDEALRWGHLTIDEKDRHRLKKRKY
jgi:dihydropteroate synthase-like protein